MRCILAFALLFTVGACGAAVRPLTPDAADSTAQTDASTPDDGAPFLPPEWCGCDPNRFYRCCPAERVVILFCGRPIPHCPDSGMPGYRCTYAYGECGLDWDMPRPDY